MSFDPRGVAGSAGVNCRTDKEAEDAYRKVDMTPDTAAEEAAFMKDGADFGAGCERRSGKVLPYVGTTNAARDMDLIREVLGDKKLTYFGMSYGTELGGTYAHLFPKKVGRTVWTPSSTRPRTRLGTPATRRPGSSGRWRTTSRTAVRTRRRAPNASPGCWSGSTRSRCRPPRAVSSTSRSPSPASSCRSTPRAAGRT